MVKTAVCDDQPVWGKAVANILQAYARVPLQVTVFQSGEQLLACKETFEIIFLDVDLAAQSGISGIETARELRKWNRKAKIIYLTNYADYSMEALAVHAFAYLIKNNDMERVKREIHGQLDEVFEYLNIERQEVLEFMTAQGLTRVKVSDIFCFEYQERRVKMTAQNGEFMLKKRISDVAQEMQRYDFSAPHKSFVVNLYHVKAVRGTEVVLSNGNRIPLSQKKAAVFRKTLNAYLGRITGGGEGR